MTTTIADATELFRQFRFRELFTSLGWNEPSTSESSEHMAHQAPYSRRVIAELPGIQILEVWTPGRHLEPPSADMLHIYISKDHPGALMIYLDHPEQPTMAHCVWGRPLDDSTKILSLSYFQGEDPQSFFEELIPHISELLANKALHWRPFEQIRRAPVLTVMAGDNAFLLTKRPEGSDGDSGSVCCGPAGSCGQHPMSHELLEKFSAWGRTLESHRQKQDGSDALDWDALHARGLELATALKNEVGGGLRVVYEKPTTDPEHRLERRSELLTDGTLLPLPDNPRSLAASIRNCRRGAECEQSWATLDLLPDADLRFCESCRKPVHLVRRPEQLWEEIAAGRCVTMTTI